MAHSQNRNARGRYVGRSAYGNKPGLADYLAHNARKTGANRPGRVSTLARLGFAFVVLQ